MKVIRNDCADKKFSLKMQNHLSQDKYSIEGLLQGGMLSATPFKIYFNDIKEAPYTDLSLFVDVTAIFVTSIKENQAKQYIQNLLNILEIYFEKLKIQLTTFSHRRKRRTDQIPITLNGVNIPESASIKSLKVILDKKILFHENISKIKTKPYETIQKRRYSIGAKM